MKKLALGVLVSAFSLLATGIVSAATIGFSPQEQVVAPGDDFTVDIVVWDLLGGIVSAYDLDVTYDSSVIMATDVIFGTALGDGGSFETFNDSDISAPGLIDFAQLSLLSDLQLADLQGGDSVLLATLEFTATGLGTSLLSFEWGLFDGATGGGAAGLDLHSVDGVVTTAIPEPTAALAFAVGAALIGGAVRRQKTRHW